MYYTLKVLQKEVSHFIFKINNFANLGVCFPLQLHSYIFHCIVESLVVDNQRNYFTLVGWLSCLKYIYGDMILLYIYYDIKRFLLPDLLGWHTSKALVSSNFTIILFTTGWRRFRSLDTVLEVFGDVVVGLGVLQTLHKGI